MMSTLHRIPVELVVSCHRETFWLGPRLTFLGLIWQSTGTAVTFTLVGLSQSKATKLGSPSLLASARGILVPTSSTNINSLRSEYPHLLLLLLLLLFLRCLLPHHCPALWRLASALPSRMAAEHLSSCSLLPLSSVSSPWLRRETLISPLSQVLETLLAAILVWHPAALPAWWLRNVVQASRPVLPQLPLLCLTQRLAGSRLQECLGLAWLVTARARALQVAVAEAWLGMEPPGCSMATMGWLPLAPSPGTV